MRRCLRPAHWPVLVVLLMGGVAAGAARTPEQAADAVLAALAAKDDATLEVLADLDKPDPWLVADALVVRGRLDEALAFAGASSRPDFQGLPGYVASRRGRTPDAGARRSVAESNAALASRRWDDALRAIDAARPDGEPIPQVRLDFGRGLALRGKGRPEESAASFRRAGEAAEALGWLSRAADSQSEAYQSSVAGGDVDQVVASLEALASLEGRRGHPGDAAEALELLGRTHLDVGDLPKGADALERAAAAHRANGDVRSEAHAMCDIGLAFGRAGEHAVARPALDRALAGFEAAGDGPGMVKVLSLLIILDHKRGDLATARTACERVVGILEASGDAAAAGRHRVNLADLQNRTGDFAAALSTWQRVARDAEARGDPAGAANATVGIGNSRALLGEYAKALTALERGLQGFEAVGDEHAAAYARRSLAGVQYVVGEHAAAAANYRRALAAFESLGDQGAAAVTLGNLANLWSDTDQPEEALRCYRRALAAHEELGNAAAAAHVRLNLGTLYVVCEAFPEALAEFERAHEALVAAGDRDAAATALRNVGHVQLDVGEPDRALATFRQVLAADEETGGRDGLARTLAALSMAHRRLGQVAESLDAARRAAKEASAVAVGLGVEEGAGARDPLSYVYDAGMEAAVAADDPEQFAFFLEGGRAGALLEGLQGRELLWTATIPADLRQAAARAREGEAAALQALDEALATGDRAAARARRSVLESAREHVSAVTARIQREAKEGASLVCPQPAALAEVRGALGEGEALVLYGDTAPVVHEDTTAASYALVVTRAEARIVRLGDVEPIEEAVGALLLDDPDTDPSAALAKLKELVVDPLGLEANATRVLVSPTGALAYVPFLPLLGRRDVVLVPSATTWLLLLDESSQRGDGVLALGDPDYEAGGGATRGGVRLGRLPASGVEATAVGDVVRLGKEASERGLRDALAPRPRWRAVHLACHGLVDAEHPMRSSLALTASGEDDGFLTALDILGLRCPADLVVLSACETGKGRVYKAEGIVGLTRAFMFAGVPRVLVSLWKVDDEATRALMTKFYELWNPKGGSKGLSTAAALRKAQEFVASQEPWKHPYYWAAWVLWGIPG